MNKAHDYFVDLIWFVPLLGWDSSLETSSQGSLKSSRTQKSDGPTSVRKKDLFGGFTSLRPSFIDDLKPTSMIKGLNFSVRSTTDIKEMSIWYSQLQGFISCGDLPRFFHRRRQAGRANGWDAAGWMGGDALQNDCGCKKQQVNKWLVVWNILIFPYIGNNNPNWLIFFRGVQTTNQNDMMDIHWYSLDIHSILVMERPNIYQ